MARKRGLAIGKPTILVGITGVGDTMASDMAPLGRVLKNSTVLDTSEGSDADVKDEHDNVVHVETEPGKTTLVYSVFVYGLEILKKIFGGTIVTSGVDDDVLTGLKNGFSAIVEDFWSFDISWRAGVGIRAPKSKVTATVVSTSTEGILLKMKHTVVAPEGLDADMIEPYEPKAA